jgi:PAS domain S-box-containing protein
MRKRTMRESAGHSLRATVAADATGEGDPLADAVEAATGLVVTGQGRVDGPAAVAAVREADTDCVVCVGADAYAAVREADEARDGDADAAVPVVVVATDEETAQRAVDDDAAAFVHADGPVATLVPERVRQVVGRDGDGVAWDVAALADQAVVQFDVETFDVLAANDAFRDAWDVDIEDATLADLRVTDITHERRGHGGAVAGEEQLEWVTEGSPVETLVGNARNGDFEVREWHCEGVDGEYFKSKVQLVVDPTADVGYLVATVPDEEDGDGTQGGEPKYDEASMLQSVMEHVPMSVYFEDRQGRHVLVSEDLVDPFIEATDGKIMHTPEDVHGKTYWDLYTPDMAVRATADNEGIVETGEPLRGQEKHVQPPNGRDLWFSTNKAPWYDDDGRAQGIVGITVDITDQKHRERELNRQNERLSEFASIVSHDLRNPLNVAEGRLELYRRTGDESELDKIEEMHERIADLIDEVLAFAREGSHVEDTEWVDGHPQAWVAWEAVDTGEASLVQEWDDCIEADASRLVRLFENLFRNSVEHSDTDVTVTVGTLDEAGFYVQDDGPGVPGEVRDDLFERGVSTDEEGTGFGLAIVREIAEAHGWTVELAESDGGARFEFTGVPSG